MLIDCSVKREVRPETELQELQDLGMSKAILRARNPVKKLSARKKAITVICRSDRQRYQQTINGESVGGRKLSKRLKLMRFLLGDMHIDEKLLKVIFLEHLFVNIKILLPSASQGFTVSQLV
ncbi:unnamed protein product [Dibothriocephalus latus]|uniref:Uncharacterized protein n=1 Tax=Dibothriocephalus latus TaxID=60516 RepID=A0A3P7NST5_DIBLA|nr:unnamed protein product [Dibothriocephalus latus]